MTYNIVTKETVPEGPWEYGLVCIPRQAIPFVLGAIRIKRQKYWWLTDEDWHRAEDLLIRFEGGIVEECSLPIVNAIDRLTIRFDAAVNGITRTATLVPDTEAEYEYSPPLTQEAEAGVYNSPSLAADSDAVVAFLDHIVNGTVNEYVTDTRAVKDLLQSIVDTQADPEVKLEQIRTILALIATLL
jgi:hypothetical protein